MTLSIDRFTRKVILQSTAGSLDLTPARQIAIFVFFALGPAYAQDDPRDFFEKRVRPVLASRCYACHTGAQSGGLRLDSRAALLAGGKSGAAIVPGKPQDSLLIRAVTHADPRLRMPLSSPKLADREIAALSSWIEAGAPWPEDAAAGNAFWSFLPLRKPTPPPVRNTSWARSPIDRFILAAIEREGLQPAPAADRRTLLRRATFDLTGLPPTPAEVQSFLSDKSPEAFAKVVDRLLASPHYGERWGRHWLDVARYADGDAPDNRPVYIGYGMAEDGFVNSFRYRDWVVDAFQFGHALRPLREGPDRSRPSSRAGS
jgi:hypothetical protein